jgi:hypothetical protein
MTRLRVLFIGGSGVISSACSRFADAALDAVMDKLAAAWTLEAL